MIKVHTVLSAAVPYIRSPSLRATMVDVFLEDSLKIKNKKDMRYYCLTTLYNSCTVTSKSVKQKLALCNPLYIIYNTSPLKEANS